VITLDFSKAPGTHGSPFRQVLQTHGTHGDYRWFLQQFGNCWGWLITDGYRMPIECNWSIDWQAPDALADLNRVLETL
jgi:hypothetical protein